MKKYVLLGVLVIIFIILIAFIAIDEFSKNENNSINMSNSNEYIPVNNVVSQSTNKDEKKPENSNFLIVPTLDEKLEDNSAWCATFQLIWNDLKNDLAKQDIIFTPQLDVVKNLNKEDFNSKMLSEDYYYKKYGIMNEDLKNEIKKGIKDKFDEESKILDDFDWNDMGDDKYFLYSMLKREFEFLTKFDELEDGKFADKYENIKYFGIDSKSNEELRNQIDVLYYNSDEDFAVILNTKQDDEVILCRTSTGSTFNEIYNNIEKAQEKYKGAKKLTEVDTLKVPNMKFDEKKEFEELQNKVFKFSNGEEYFIEKAIQTIEFELDSKGGKVLSEAGMAIKQTALRPDETPEVRNFNLDDVFTIFIREKGKEKPYFAAKIENISNFQ